MLVGQRPSPPPRHKRAPIGNAGTATPPPSTLWSRGAGYSPRRVPLSSTREVKYPRKAQVGSRPLSVRVSHASDSQLCHDPLPPGQAVSILQELATSKGVRALVTDADDPTKRLGWVTSFVRGQTARDSNLQVVDERVTPRSTTLSLTDRGESSSRGDESMAGRIAKRRQERHTPRQLPAGFRRARAEKVLARAGGELRSVQSLLELASRLHDASVAEEATEGTFGNLHSRIGRILIARNFLEPSRDTIDVLVEQWDRNRDGEIQKNEFRSAIRSLGLTQEVRL
jgi:hypothetical protein